MKDAYIRTRVTEEVKRKIIVMAESQGMTESEYLRFLVAVAIQNHERAVKK